MGPNRKAVIDHIRKLPAAAFNGPVSNPAHATMTSSSYLREREGVTLAALPACPELDAVAVALRVCDQNDVARLVTGLVSVFHEAWGPGPAIDGATTVVRNKTVGDRDYDWKLHERGAIWDRLITPRWTVDTVELSGRKLSFILGQP